MREANHNDEHLLTPLLLVFMNVSALIGFYLLYEFFRQQRLPAGSAEAGYFLVLFWGALGMSGLALRYRRRLFLIANCLSHVALYILFFG